MPGPGGLKRIKELHRQDKRKEKEDRRAQRSKEKETRPAGQGDEDPDIAGIIPGPQPVIEE